MEPKLKVKDSLEDLYDTHLDINAKLYELKLQARNNHQDMLDKLLQLGAVECFSINWRAVRRRVFGHDK